MEHLTHKMRIYSASLIPKKLGLWSYSQVLSVLVLVVKKRLGKSAHLWARNSFLTDHFTPGLSDLDLTLYIDGDFEPLKLKSFLKNLEDLRWVFPILGEVNVYSSSWTPHFIDCVNYYELERDPQLQKKIGEGLKPNKFQASIYLARMLESDLKNLSLYPALRRGKWMRHFSKVKMSAGDITIRGIAEKVVEGAGLDFSSVNTLMAYLKEYSPGKFAHEITHTKEVWLFFPNRIAYFHERFPELTENEAQIFKCAIEWEVWGLMSQIFSDRLGDLQGHLENILKCVKRAQETQKNVSFESLAKSIEDFKEMSSKFR